MRQSITAILTIVALAGCHMPSSLPTAHDGRSPETAGETPAPHAPILAGRVSFGDRHLQTIVSEVAKAATVSLINSGNNQTVSTALTNASGAFVLDFSNGYRADPSAVYYLEAVKGLGGNLPGHDAVRVRTIVKYQDGWKSLTNTVPNQGIVLNPATTALAIGAGLRKSEAGFTFASLIGTLAGESSDVYSPIDGLPLSDFQALGPLVTNVLASNRDPIRSIGLLAPSNWHRLDESLSLSAIAPTQGPAGTAVALSGSGFTSTPADHAVSFNGVTAAVSAATPMSLTSSVPAGATSGETAVRIGNLMALGPSFTVPVSVTSLNPSSGPVGTTVTIVGAGFSTLADENLVRFNGVPAKVTAATPTQITVQVPVTTSGPVALAVSGVSAEVPRFAVPVAVESLMPSIGRPGMSVTIAGSGFSPIPGENVVHFNGVPTTVSAATPTQLTVSVPFATTGPVTVAVSGESTAGPGFTIEPLALRALHPETAAPGTSLMLEGTFTDSLTVNFPGAGAVAAEVLGPHRARVVVPPLATSGNLTVSAESMVSNALQFQSLGASPTLGAFEAGPSLGQARNNAALLRHRNRLFLIGGTIPVASSSTQYPAAVFRADIVPSDNIGSFTTTGVNLLTPRQGHSAQVLGDYLYVIGGGDAVTGQLASVERARIQGDGSLGAFADAGIALKMPRSFHTSAVIGSHLYVFGGTLLATAAERALIQPDGTLGAFEHVGKPLPAIRQHASLVIGESVYLFGGDLSQPPGNSKTVMRASIHPDGTLGEFANAGIGLFSVTGHTTGIMLGSHVYLLGGGGFNDSSLDLVQRAAIQADGTLGEFESAGTLGLRRRQHTHVIVGHRIHLLGGNGYHSGSPTSYPITTPYSAPFAIP